MKLFHIHSFHTLYISYHKSEKIHDISLSYSCLFHLTQWSLVPFVSLNVRISYFVWLLYFIMYAHYTFFIQLPVGGHAGWFHIFATVKWAAINIVVQASLLYADFISSGYIPSSEITGSQGRSILSFLQQLHTLFHYGLLTCTSIIQQYIRVLVSS